MRSMARGDWKSLLRWISAMRIAEFCPTAKTRSTSGEHFLVSIAKMGPGVKSPPHHHNYPQIFYIIEGTGTAVIAGNEFKFAPGHVLRLLNCEDHTIINDGPGEVTLMEIRVFSTP